MQLAGLRLAERRDVAAADDFGGAIRADCQRGSGRNADAEVGLGHGHQPAQIRIILRIERRVDDGIRDPAAKAGTTSLLAYLAEQPDVGVSIRKDVRYFDFNYDRGRGWYRAHFVHARRIIPQPAKRKT